jgi:hypothetical protein
MVQKAPKTIKTYLKLIPVKHFLMLSDVAE